MWLVLRERGERGGVDGIKVIGEVDCDMKRVKAGVREGVRDGVEGWYKIVRWCRL